MKKGMTLILIFVLMISVCACQMQSTSDLQKSPTPVTTTTTQSVTPTTAATQTETLPMTQVATQTATPTTTPIATKTATQAATQTPTQTPTQTQTAEPTPIGTPTPTPFVVGDTQYTTYQNPSVEKADYQARTLFLVSVPSFADSLTLATLQGLVANKGTEQILLNAGAYAKYKAYLESVYNVTVERKNSENKTWTTWRLVAHFKDKIAGYILCDDDQNAQSCAVAISLANQLNAVVVTKDKEEKAIENGLTCVLDVTGKTDAWLRQSSYFDKINQDMAVEQPASMSPRLVDYAVMSGSYFRFSDSTDKGAHTNLFNYLNKNAVVLGWNNTLGEYSTVSSFSSINAGMIPADHAFNISTLSSLRMETISQKTEVTPASDNKHTVCFVMSDGDNLQWITNDFTTSSNWYGSSLRGKFNMGWGLPATAIDLTAPMVNYLYDDMTAKDEFIMQLSGLGYTFPSQWTDKAALADMAEELDDYMERADIRIAEILDDGGFQNSILDIFTAQKNIDAIFYIDYANYAGYRGQILWSNNKPAISARYRLWAGLGDGSVENIVNGINAASTDPKSADSYSFVIVHAWSGLDSNGNLVAGGNTMKAVEAVINGLDSDVEVVTPSAFIDKIIKNKPQ